MSSALSPRPAPQRSSSVPPPASVKRPVAPARIAKAPPLPPKRPPLPTPVATSTADILQEEMRLFVKAAIADAVAPLRRAIEAAQARVEELEAKLAAAPAIPAPAAPPLRATSLPPAPLLDAQIAPAPYLAAPPFAEPFATIPPPAIAPPAAVVPLESWVPESNVSIDHELRAMDGDRRRKRLAMAVGFAVLLVVGGMLSAMALSYA
ncbi:MAG: hypothetical protein ACLQBL_24235 [Polyangiaceae bacterium]